MARFDPLPRRKSTIRSKSSSPIGATAACTDVSPGGAMSLRGPLLKDDLFDSTVSARAGRRFHALQLRFATTHDAQKTAPSRPLARRSGGRQGRGLPQRRTAKAGFILERQGTRAEVRPSADHFVHVRNIYPDGKKQDVIYYRGFFPVSRFDDTARRINVPDSDIRPVFPSISRPDEP
jgi:hypothetical protein